MQREQNRNSCNSATPRDLGFSPQIPSPPPPFRKSQAAEQLVGIEQDSGKFTPSHHARFYLSSSSYTARTPRFRSPDDVTGNDYFLLAKSYFDCGDIRRAAHTLRDQPFICK